MAKLKIITLTIQERPDENPLYSAIDDDGKVLATREECLSFLGKPYIAAVVTKNHNYLFPYSIHNLFTGFHRISTKLIEDKRCRPYAIAIAEEQKEAFRRWYKEKKAKKAKQDHERREVKIIHLNYDQTTN